MYRESTKAKGCIQEIYFLIIKKKLIEYNLLKVYVRYRRGYLNECKAT